MDKDKPKLEFFNDIKTQLLLVLGGIVSLTTVIPAFLNSTSQLFGWDNIRYGYYLFVLLYFIIPYLFYVFYCSIHDDVGYLELLSSKKLKWLKERRHTKNLIETAIPLIVFLYMVWPACPFEEILSLILYISSLACFIYFAFAYYKYKVIFKEFLIITSIIFIAFLLFLCNLLYNASKYSADAQKQAFEAYQKKGVFKNGFTAVLDSARREAYKCRMQAALLRPALESSPLKDYSCKTCALGSIYNIIYTVDTTKNQPLVFLKEQAVKLNTAVNRMLNKDQLLVKANDGSLYHVIAIYQACSYLYDYGVAVEREKQDSLNGQWAKLLQNLQFKSMLWFHFLIILGMCLWLKMQCDPVSGTTLYSEMEVEAAKKTDNISQVKSLVLLLLVLIVPWLRRIDSKEIELERPFLNITLAGLVEGTPRPVTANCSVNIERARPDTARIISVPFIVYSVDTVKKVDTIRIPVLTFSPYIYKRDSILNTINKNVLNNGKLIIDQAKKAIGNPKDRHLTVNK
jgi:hypothetical protein